VEKSTAPSGVTISIPQFFKGVNTMLELLKNLFKLSLQCAIFLVLIATLIFGTIGALKMIF
jgi:uncharacterized membrane protein